MKQQTRNLVNNQLPTDGKAMQPAALFEARRREQRSTWAERAPLAEPDLVCFSHLRWDFVYQRPQHLLSRCAQGRRVFFFEEPVYDGGPLRLEVKERGRVRVVV